MVRETRSGFTLIELLVVMGLIILLAAITISVSYSGLIDNYRTIGAGDRVSKWLLIAKSKAQRDQLPCGVRFYADDKGMIREAQYIEVPESYVPVSSDTTNKQPPLLTIVKAGAGGGGGGGGGKSVQVANVDAGTLGNNVQAGDTLNLPEFKLMLQVASATGGTVTLNNPSMLPDLGAADKHSTTSFGFLRAARPMAGEEMLLLTGSTAIDGGLCKPQIAANTQFDVLFAPSGEIINAQTGSVILWVRDPSLAPGMTLGTVQANYDKAGQMGLITIYSKTGSIATHPVTRGADPYAATKDGMNTGM